MAHTSTFWTKFAIIPSSGSEEDLQIVLIFQPIRGHGSHV
jgi:hypothetical protein